MYFQESTFKLFINIAENILCLSTNNVDATCYLKQRNYQFPAMNQLNIGRLL